MPLVAIKVNGKVIYSNKINDELSISFPIELLDNTNVTLIGIGKSASESYVIDKQGVIVNDKFLVINDIFIDQISMGTEWIKTINTIENYQTNSIYNNGQISFTISAPVLDWIITEKYIKQELQLTKNDASVYSGLGRFDYCYIQEKIANIKKLLND